VVIVRKFEQHEWPIYRDLRLRALVDTPDAFGRTFVEEKDRPDQEWSSRLVEWLASAESLPLLAIADGKPSGLLFARLEGESGDIVHLYSMWVDPATRRQGVGRELVDVVMNWSRARRARRIHLRVAEHNLAAIGLYERAGLRRTSERTELRPGSPLFAVTMELTL
jgi:ribosomal protein S18 acetylase RimI-like enzyme